MTDKNELKQEQLEKVSGGMPLAEGEKKYRDKYTRKIGTDEAANYVGQNLYFVEDYDITNNSPDTHVHTFIFGTLTKVFDQTMACGDTRKVGSVTVIESKGSHFAVGGTDVFLNDWQIYVEG